jgi:outer membrane protein OmpA-like peptidoglycan-associated protein
MKNTLLFKKTFICLAFLGTLLSAQNATSQTVIDQETEVLIRKANNKYIFEEFNKALPLYLTLLEKEPDNFLYNYRTGICYLKSNVETVKGVKYLEKANSLKALTDGATAEFYFYLGYSHQIINQFDKAIEYYTLSKTFPDVNDSLINVSLKQCELGKVIAQKPTNARIYNLGTEINSIYPDYAPVLLSDRSNLTFASTRAGSTGGKVSIDGDDYYEDIYVAKTTKIKYTPNLLTYAKGKKIGMSINTRLNDAPITMGANKTSLFVFRKNTIWQTDFTNGQFGAPVHYKNPVLSRKNIGSSLSFTKDGQTMYFVDSRKGGYGGKDIYKSERQEDGTWGPAINLGETINTSLNEESPYFNNEEQTLYFSSRGHNSIGGFDIFKSQYRDGRFREVQNLGVPINSGSDEIGYSYDAKTNVGYFSTMRADGIGNYDIYMLRYVQPLTVKVKANYLENLAPKNLLIQALNTQTNDTFSFTLNPDSTVKYQSNSQYRLLIPRYNTDTIVDTLLFDTPEAMGDYTYYQEVNYEPVRNHKDSLIGYKTTIYNAFFNVEEVIDRKGLRNKKFMFEKFPTCNTNHYEKYAYYTKDGLTKDEEYSLFLATLDPTFKDFNVYTQINYIDTSSFVADSIYAANALSRGIHMDSPPMDTLYKTILFDFTSDSVKTKFMNELQDVVNFLNKNPELFVEVIGHTDGKGNFPSNLKLSIERANEVKDLLVEKGIAKDRIIPIGKGKLEPVYPNKFADGRDNPDGRRMNRRVEFHMVNP